MHVSLTVLRQRHVTMEHVRVDVTGRHLAGDERDHLLPLPHVDGHEESAADAHALRAVQAVAEERRDGSVHGVASSANHVPEIYIAVNDLTKVHMISSNCACQVKPVRLIEPNSGLL